MHSLKSHKKSNKCSTSLQPPNELDNFLVSNSLTTDSNELNILKSKYKKVTFSWITSELWKKWEAGGKQIFFGECHKMLKQELLDEKRKNVTTSGFYKAILELLRAGTKGLLRKDKVSHAINDLISFSSKAATLICDAFSVMNENYSFSDEDSRTKAEEKLHQNFCSIVNDCPLIKTCLIERMDIDSLKDTGLITNWTNFSTKFVRIKTKLYYKQSKFNLFREESEGYGKLITELNQPVTNVPVIKMTKILQCLIGRFNLEPNRVIDIILEAFECQPVPHFFIPLLKSLNPSSHTISEMVGFKLANVETPSESLYLIIALLIQHNVISLEEFYPWFIENQKFCLCEAFLEIGAWEHAQSIFSRLPEFSCVSNKRIAVKLIKLLHYILDPLYKKLNMVSPKLGTSKSLNFEKNLKVPKQIYNYEEFNKANDMILALGPYVYHDPVLIYKFVRIIKSHLQKAQKKHSKITDAELYYDFYTILDQVILPSLNFLESNCATSDEIWSCLKFYHYYHRFHLYNSWKSEEIMAQHPSLLKIKVDSIKKVKHLMRRISKENVKPMGRLLGKLSHSNPVMVFDYILSQIQLFDNLINPVVDALKFLTSLSFDVLGYCLLEALSPSISLSKNQSISLMLMPNRPRTKHDGSTIAPWLQSLASFAGAICKKYTIELVPLLQYISNQLKSKQCLDLLLLKEIVQKMTGIEASEDMTSEQLEAMSGGEILRGEAGYFGQVRATKRSANRLRDAANKNDLSISLCILMSQQRNCILYDESAEGLHSKLTGKLYDECQDTLVQFGSFIATSTTLDEYAEKIPSLEELYNKYHVSPEVNFFLWRPIFAHEINNKYEELRKQERKDHKSLTTVQKQQKYTKAANLILDRVVDMMKTFLPVKTFDDISAQFYVTFWSLTLYDLYVPNEVYAKEIARIKHISIAALDNKDLTSSKRKKEQERCSALIEKLLEEQKRQKEHVDRVMAKLNKEKDTWFASRVAKSAKNEAVTAFLQLCLFPRCIFTAHDALYCANFVNIIHSLSTPNFSTLICFDRIFCDIIYTVTSCTENEANRYGRFLCALLSGVMKWHGDREIFNKECASYPGFVTKFRAANTFNESNDHVDYENFRHVCHKWHYKITKSIIVCLESREFIQIRNALIVLKRILPFYPRVTNLANAVERWIERVRLDEKDKRQDLFALATSYIGQLKAKWGTIIPEEDFHQKSVVTKKLPSLDGDGKIRNVKLESNYTNGGSLSSSPKDSPIKEPPKESLNSSQPQLAKDLSPPNNSNLQQSPKKKSFSSKGLDQLIPSLSSSNNLAEENTHANIKSESASSVVIPNGNLPDSTVAAGVQKESNSSPITNNSSKASKRSLSGGSGHSEKRSKKEDVGSIGTTGSSSGGGGGTKGSDREREKTLNNPTAEKAKDKDREREKTTRKEKTPTIEKKLVKVSSSSRSSPIEPISFNLEKNSKDQMDNDVRNEKKERGVRERERERDRGSTRRDRPSRASSRVK